MTESMKNALKGNGGGLQSISSSVAETMGNAIDTRGSQSKKADQAGSDLLSMGPGPTVEGSSVGADDQIKNQSSGTGDHLELGLRKT
ncbi:hypothetical protein AMS68_000662 [Peltaster fructicola]|uniref:Uncharacterized protein n=1 Tax=Peltaster fructicola TaxID=286661 RepID=A0A6H0XKJ5_9PEZI|nr:hypothetical protein AMS68_000662 [Peltaster fructicola]